MLYNTIGSFNTWMQDNLSGLAVTFSDSGAMTFPSINIRELISTSREFQEGALASVYVQIDIWTNEENDAGCRLLRDRIVGLLRSHKHIPIWTYDSDNPVQDGFIRCRKMEERKVREADPSIRHLALTYELIYQEASS